MTKVSVPLTITAPDKVKDREEMFDLVSKVFSGHKNYYQWQEFLRENYVDPSHYDWLVSRIGRLDEKIVTHYGIWDYQMRVGSASVRTGGVGIVATDAAYRRRGLLAHTARASIEAMREAGYHFSILFGLRNFYHQFGYVRAWTKPTYRIWYGDLPQEKPSPAPRAFKPIRREDIEALYNREHRELTGTAIRPTYRKFNNVADCQALLWRGKGNQVVGYMYYHLRGRSLEILESGGDIDQTLRVVTDLMRKHRIDEAVFPALPWDHPLARRLRKMDCRLELQYEKCGGPMICTINLAGALQAMAPELTRRLKGSLLADWSGTLRIRDARETATLKMDKGQVSLAEENRGRADITLTGNDYIAQILIGTEAPDEIIRQHAMRLSGKNAMPLIETLFPEQHPILRVVDGY